MKRTRSLALVLPSGVLASCLVLACAGVKPSSSTTGSGGSNATGSGGSGTGNGGSSATGSGGSNPPPPPPGCTGGCTDFDGGPFGPDGTAGSVPSGAAQTFGGSAAGSGGPCLLEPQDGTLFPNNWLRPRFSWTSTGASDIYELHVTAPNQSPDLVVYTNQTSWTMPKSMWLALANHTQNMALTVTVLSAHGSSVSTGTSGTTFTIAPVAASGNLVYWSPQGSTNGGNTVAGQTTLNGFAVGDESVGQVLTCGKTSCDIKPPATSWETDDQGLNLRPVQCIGCHTSTPDGDFISFNDFYPWGGVLASGQPGSLGAAPTFLGAGGFKAFIQPWVGITTYSANHWTTNDHIAVAPLGSASSDTDQQPGLAWFDLENSSPLPQGQNPYTTLKGTAWNWIYAPVTNKYAAAPSWGHSPASDFIVFTMTSNVKSGRIGTGTAKLYQVPYSKAGPQTATPIPGLDSGSAQYYGSLSFDDTYIVYDQIPAATAASTHPDMNTSDTCSTGTCTWDGMYMQPASELYVTPTAGGPGIRLAANDPPKCPGQPTSPGINNTWAKWSPEVANYNGATYYWIVFSSWRQGQKDASGDPIAQLYMTVIVKPEAGPIQTYPAVYLWNQPADVSNFTPAWDVFKIGNVG